MLGPPNPGGRSALGSQSSGMSLWCCCLLFCTSKGETKPRVSRRMCARCPRCPTCPLRPSSTSGSAQPSLKRSWIKSCTTWWRTAGELRPPRSLSVELGTSSTSIHVGQGWHRAGVSLSAHIGDPAAGDHCALPKIQTAHAAPGCQGCIVLVFWDLHAEVSHPGTG